MLRWLGALAVLLCATHAGAEPPRRAEWLAGAALTFSHTTSVDLAAIAGSRAYGRANDAGPGALGLSLHGGVVTPFDLELAVTGTLAAGGLELDTVEARYFGDRAQVGSSLTARADLGVRWSPQVAPGLRLFVGPAAGLTRLAASSPLGFARLDSAAVGVDAGVRLRTSTISRVVSGHVELALWARRELPLDARVGTNSSAVLFDGSAGGLAIYAFGASAGYVFAFR